MIHKNRHQSNMGKNISTDFFKATTKKERKQMVYY